MRDALARIAKAADAGFCTDPFVTRRSQHLCRRPLRSCNQFQCKISGESRLTTSAAR
jgi:hypothetical protein